MAKKKSELAEAVAEALKRITSIYAVNGKFKAQLVNTKEGGWICQIWSIGGEGGRDRPMIRNVEPFVTKEEAIQMAQKCFAQFTGDDRYFSEEDFEKGNKAEPQDVGDDDALADHE